MEVHRRARATTTVASTPNAEPRGASDRPELDGREQRCVRLRFPPSDRRLLSNRAHRCGFHPHARQSPPRRQRRRRTGWKTTRLPRAGVDFLGGSANLPIWSTHWRLNVPRLPRRAGRARAAPVQPRDGGVRQPRPRRQSLHTTIRVHPTGGC